MSHEWEGGRKEMLDRMGAGVMSGMSGKTGGELKGNNNKA